MFVPERKVFSEDERKVENKIYEKVTPDLFKEGTTVSEEDRKKIFDDIKRDFTTALEKISYSQIARFFSLTEQRKFYTDSSDISKFIEEQLERANKTQKGELIDAKEFYEKFRDKILNKNYSRDKLKVIMEILKEYTRYIIGKEKLSNLNKGGK